MLKKKGDEAILIDFGLAKDTLSETKLTTMGSRIGTTLYMSPEQFQITKDLDSTTDIYSFGVILYEMLKITNFDYVGYELDYAQSTHTMGIVILVL